MNHPAEIPAFFGPVSLAGPGRLLYPDSPALRRSPLRFFLEENAMKTFQTLSVAALLVAALGAAHAQEQSVTVRVESGSVMASQGGEFVTVPSGAQLPPGSRVMLSENASATLVYANGCSRPLSAAGVYAVPATCVPVASTGGGATGVDVQGALILAGGTAAVAAGLASMDQEGVPPSISR